MIYSSLLSLPGKKRYGFFCFSSYQINDLNFRYKLYKSLKNIYHRFLLIFWFLFNPFILRHEAVSIAMTFRKYHHFFYIFLLETKQFQ